MEIHCEINNKSDIKKTQNKKAYKVEYTEGECFEKGYWSKWYLAHDRNDAKIQFQNEFPDKKYCRTKTY